jgi:hypothetical protein
MPVKQPNSRRNLDIAIDRVFGQSENPLQIRTVIANTIIGQLLPKGAVKGGSSLKLRYGDKATRFTRDLDAARAGELEDFLKELDIALKSGWQGFTGRIVRKDPAKPKDVPGEYIMQPFEIKLEYNGKSWVTVPLEIGHDEIGDTAVPDYRISPDIIVLFEKLGFAAPKPIALMPIPHQIAQKLHALTGDGSERAHDLIDLQIILMNETIDLPLTKNACTRLFASRKMQTWPPAVSVGSGWSTLYEAQLGDLNVLPSVEEAAERVNDLIRMIDGA